MRLGDHVFKPGYRLSSEGKNIAGNVIYYVDTGWGGAGGGAAASVSLSSPGTVRVLTRLALKY